MIKITVEAPVTLECPCGMPVQLAVPVVVEMAEGVVSARVDDGVEWTQPAWDHALAEHGPSL